MEALIAEIEQRKQGKFLPTDIGLENPPDNISDATPTAT
jgi:hypothetical protein